MTKNTTIGLLLVAALIGLGYYFSKQNPEVQDTIVETPAVVDTKTDTKPTTPITVQKPDAPIVETNSNTGTSSSTASLTGQVRPNGASTTYWFEYGETTAFGNRSTAQAVGSGYAQTPTPGFITGLKANTLYYYRLSAKNSFATVNGTTYTFQTNSDPAPKAVAPTTKTIAASEVSRTTTNVNGQINPNNSSTTYWFEYGKTTNFGNTTSLQSAGAGNTVTSVAVSLSGLDPLTKYYFRLNAQNQYGTINGAIMNFTTTGPAAPSQPTVQTSGATNIHSTDATFAGKINPNGAETTYWFEYSDNSLLSTLIGGGTSQQTLAAGTSTQTVQTDVNGLKANSKYYYRLVARNTYGTVYGSIASFTTKR